MKEFGRWKDLQRLLGAGVITDLKRQVKFELIPSQKNEFGKVIERPVTYVADFVYAKNGKQIVEDVKGFKTKEYVIKRKLMLYVHGIRIHEV
jgi:hypothetical protein